MKIQSDILQTKVKMKGDIFFLQMKQKPPLKLANMLKSQPDCFHAKHGLIFTSKISVILTPPLQILIAYIDNSTCTSKTILVGLKPNTLQTDDPNSNLEIVLGGRDGFH